MMNAACGKQQTMRRNRRQGGWENDDVFCETADLLALTATVSVAAIATAQAGAFGLNEYNAISTGAALAGGAAGGAGIGSLSFNPATLTDFSGMWASQTFTFVDPNIVIKSPVFGDTN